MRVRDAVVGDILLEEWEEACVRTPCFQRLHRIKQLGNAFHVYPSAMHTRFEHSLGVCHQVKRLFAQPQFNNFKDDHRIVRLAALLHDIVHTPFKHTLDRDAGIIIKDSLKDDYDYWIDRVWNESPKLTAEVKGDDKTTLVEILTTQDAHDLNAPYKRQMIEDTLSADLLDYTRRDAYFTTGLINQWDQRIYDHIGIANYAGKPTLVAKILNDKGKINQSAVTELTNLLRIRYVLNERVYFYPVKVAADSLLVKSIRYLLDSTSMNDQDFKDTTKEMSDEEFVNYLVESKINNVSKYATMLKNRQLPKLAYILEPDTRPSYQEQLYRKYFRGHDNLDQWNKYESAIEKEAGLDPGNIIIYCHDQTMQKKNPDFLVEGENGYVSLKSSPLWKEIDSIAAKHEKLWRCYVFSLDTDGNAIQKIETASQKILSNI